MRTPTTVWARNVLDNLQIAQGRFHDKKAEVVVEVEAEVEAYVEVEKGEHASDPDVTPKAMRNAGGATCVLANIQRFLTKQASIRR